MNKPVAWLINGYLSDEEFRTSELDVIIPLYTHSADLTDEEIEKIEHKVYLNTIAKGKSLGSYSKELIKAILRKAQEK